MADEAGITMTLDRVPEIMGKINELAQTAVMVGIPASSAGRSGSPINNATLGYIHENGSPARNIPARPWLAPVVNRLKDRAQAALQQAADFTLGNEPEKGRQQLEALGLTAVAALKNNITSGGDPAFAPNAPSTIARKGSDRPLIDTAQFLNSINYVIRRR